MSMYRFWSFFIRNNRFSYLLMVALLGFGVFSVLAIPKESAPEVQIPVGVITTTLPGAPASDIETLITNELERGLIGTVDDVAEITSESRDGVSQITVEFDAGADITESINSLKDEVDTLQPELPSEANESRVSEVDFQDQPIMRVAVAGDVNDRSFTELADDLEAELERIPGVARVELSGVRERAVAILLDQSSLARYELSTTDVVQAIRAANTTLPVGQITSDGIIYNIAFEGDIQSTRDIADVPIGERGGQPIYVHDVATVDDGLAEATTLTRLSVAGTPSERAFAFNVFKQRGGDITQLAAAVRDRLDHLQTEGELLQDLRVLVVQDAGELIERDLLQLTTSGMQTVALVILALIVAIGWREGLIAGTAIPLSFTIGFIGLYLSGNTINFISLFALILGIGVLVDSSIVMVEGINRRMKDDPTIDKKQAALLTIKEFSTPLVAGTLTTVSMFVGLFIVSGVTGQFIASIPFTLLFILFASLLVALGFLPLIASSLLRRRSATKLEQKQVAYAHQLEDWYRRQISRMVGHSGRERTFLWGIILTLFLTLSFPFIGIVEVIFFETGDVDNISIDVELPEGTTKERTDIPVRRVEEILYSKPYITSFLTTVGGSDESTGSVFVTFDESRQRSSSELIDELRAELNTISTADISIAQPQNGPPTGSPIGVTFRGTDLAVLTELSNQAALLLADIPGTTNVETTANDNNVEFVAELDRNRAAAVGVTPQTVSSLMRTAVFGTDATSITTLADDIDVVVRLNLSTSDITTAAEATTVTVASLNRITVPTRNGETIPLGSLVDISLRESNTRIAHEDGQRVVEVIADTTSDGNVMEINQTFRERTAAELEVPAGVTMSLGGETEESSQAFREMGIALVVGIVLMLSVLVLQFNSYRHTFYVLSILPFSLIGIMTGLALTNSALSFPSIMGFIALSGIVVNNSILLIDMMNGYRREHPDMPMRDVVIESATKRLRPILLTTVTTVIGMIPLLYTDEIWAPLAYAIMFGLLFSVVITLLLIPVIYHRNPGELG